jgi:hypothetical protein
MGGVSATSSGRKLPKEENHPQDTRAMNCEQSSRTAESIVRVAESRNI